MIKDALVYFASKVQEAVTPQFMSLDGRPYTTKQAVPLLEPCPDPINIHTLSGLVDYINGRIDIYESGIFVHIVDYNIVRVCSPLVGAFDQRMTYVEAKCQDSKFRFGEYYDVESFVIAIQAMFYNDGHRSEVLRIVGNMKDERVKTVSDDGITQIATVKDGIALNKEAIVPNPVLLYPFRTFNEIDQPGSSFVFRVKSKDGAIGCALFEADGGLWKNDAITSIKKYLSENIKCDSNGIQIIA